MIGTLKLIAYSGLLTVAICFSKAEACTSAIISGRLTADGRPLMWKNRDTSNLDNCVRFMKGEKFDYIAVTGYAKNPKSIWIGTNEAGFSIMNTLSYNLNEENGPKGNRNGSIMARALEICRTVDDFRNYLDTIPRPILASANYGVMDAYGHAGYFETGNKGYMFYDVDDPRVAPHGYIVRSNFSVGGRFEDGGGHIRYQQAENSIYKGTGTHEMTPQWIFCNLSRSFKNPLMEIDLRSGILNKPNGSGWTTEQDFIARKSTSCAVVIQGVKPGENPDATVMWTSIGYPPVTPFVPLWVAGAENKLPKVVFSETEKGAKSSLCDAGNQLRNSIYNYKRGNLVDNYFNWERLFNNSGNGYMQLTEAYENGLFKGIYRQVEQIQASPDVKAIYRLYDEIDSSVIEHYRDAFDIEL
ncbi:MAG: C45 family peptidase [Muribaculaceae bacterium]|nr:C45 family peptidase [Muribaculaceae bacterium]